ncbi:AraC family transcriptional regulator [Paenibacillus sp. HJL G12]|uniref:AraC family transcriptional regulator n=1 Tax=Paenibacillus dendrobii TaxID=2691084 RepID=A0A7X3IMD9_9BACL|nr:helix-turn-helix domain-containing protein [Paenibacillus dendrobii]MWV46036.1 AraC family transcriptional regulator [Paenibacillus dendrobii]
MKVLIVDDEVIIRTGLSTVIDWEQGGFTILEPASSAEEALLRIPSERPEIIFTDIRMTGKSGLDLIREVKADCPDTEWIVISGYDEFAYAQQAIREGVSEYLLKTSRPDEIIQAALRAKGRLEMRRKSDELGREKDQLLNRSFLSSLLSAVSVPAEEALQELWTRYPQLRPEGGSYLQIWLITASSRAPEAGQNRETLYRSLGSLFMEEMTCEWLPWNESLLLLMHAKDGSVGWNPVEQLLRKAGQKLDCRLFAACGKPVSDAMFLREALDTAITAKSYEWLLGGQHIVRFEDIQTRKGCRGMCTHEEEAALTALLKSGDETALRNWVTSVTDQLRIDGQATPTTASAYLHSLILAGQRWLERAAASIGYNRQLQEREEAGRVRLADETQQELFRRFRHMMEEYRRLVSETTPVERAVTYIHEHLEQSLSLAQVARHVHMNPNYFSEVFKRETGQNYIEFVTQAKLRQAMVLLSETPAKISEVAKRIGYEDIKYFNRLFKKFTGKTPSEYRGNS